LLAKVEKTALEKLEVVAKNTSTLSGTTNAVPELGNTESSRKMVTSRNTSSGPKPVFHDCI